MLTVSLRRVMSVGAHYDGGVADRRHSEIDYSKYILDRPFIF